MKKLKVLPSALMLILCIGALSIGIFAIAPTQNTISGQITINASPANVKIECFVGDSTTEPSMVYEDVRAGINWQPNFMVDLSSVNTLEEVPEYELTIRITNKSEKELGVYFFEPGTEQYLEDGLASGKNIQTEAVITNADISDVSGNRVPLADGEEEKTFFDVTFDLYKYIAPKSDTTGNVVEMKIKFKCADFIGACKVLFDYQLNIEEYVSNVSATEMEGKAKLQGAKWICYSVATWEEDQDDDGVSETYVSIEGLETPELKTCGTPNAPEFVKLDKNVTSLTGLVGDYNEQFPIEYERDYIVDGGEYTPGMEDMKYQTGVQNFTHNTDIKYLVGTNKLKSLGCNVAQDMADYYEIFGPFYGCTNLTWASIGNTSILSCAFEGCSNLQRVQFETNEIRSEAFADCISLQNLDLSNKILDYRAFANCDSLTKLDLTNTQFGLDWGYGSMFAGCDSLEQIDISNAKLPEDAEYIENIFYGCTSLKYVNAQNAVIPNASFTNCSSLKYVNAQNADVGDFAFVGCSNLKYVNLLGANIGKEIFSNCNFDNIEVLFDNTSKNGSFGNFTYNQVKILEYVGDGYKVTTDGELIITTTSSYFPTISGIIKPFVKKLYVPANITFIGEWEETLNISAENLTYETQAGMSWYAFDLDSGETLYEIETKEQFSNVLATGWKGLKQMADE